ncbi:MAG: CPBP family intramembrane metalloprotease [Agathobacter sp.]|nr:CPBP family intramembrane metalloprotease [Agathobacter sp.]
MKKKFPTLLLSCLPFAFGLAMQVAVMTLLIIVAEIFMFVIGPIWFDTNFDPIKDLDTLLANTNFNALIMIAFSVCCTVFFGIWYYKSCGGNFRFSFKRQFHPLQPVGLLFLTPGTQFAASIVISSVAILFPKWIENYMNMMDEAGMTEMTVLLFIYSVILAPISEELIFRGVTMRIARKAFPFWAANLIQAVLFGVFHMNIVQGIYAGLFGLVLGIICEKGGSIYFSIFFHFLFNLWGSTAADWLAIENEPLSGLIIILGSALGLGLGILFFLKGTNKVAKKRSV